MKQKIHFVLCLFVGLTFINAGLNKFFNYMPAPDNLPESQVRIFMAFAEIGWLFPLIAVIEIIGGTLFIIPRFRALGALMLFPVLVGILFTNVTVALEALPMGVIIFAVWAWALFENKAKLIPLLKGNSN